MFLKKSLKFDKGKLIVIIAGPTGTILSYDLSLHGYQALDIGHIVKSYDYFISGKKINNMQDAVGFFDN